MMVQLQCSGGSGQIVTMDLQKATSADDIRKALKIDVSVSASYGLLSGSASFDFAESSHFSSYSVYLVTSVTVQNDRQMINNIRPRPHAVDLISQGKFTQFYDEYGDYFIEGIQTGGAYYAVLEFSTQNSTELTNISAALDISYLAFKAGGDFSSSMQNIESNTDLIVHNFQMGGSDTTQPTTINDVISHAENFGSNVKDNGVPIRAFLQDYKRLDWSNIPNFVDVENARVVLVQYQAALDEIFANVK